MAKSRVIGLVAARQGSKGMPGKNVKLLGGYPLIAYSVVASLLSKGIERTIVSTDSEEYAAIARSFGAEVPFIRPKELAGDRSDAIEYVRHALEWLYSNERSIPEYIVLLCPPSPLRDPVVIDAAIKRIFMHPEATSLRSVRETQESPYKLFTIDNGYLKGMFPDDPRQEYYNLPRQTFPKVFHPDGYIDIIKASTVLNRNSLTGDKMIAFISPGGGDIDRPEDFEHVEYLLGKSMNPIYEHLKSKHRSER